MMNRAQKTTVLAALLLAACDRESEPAPEPTVEQLVEVPEDTVVYVADRDREALPSHRIYYTLTQHEWYARGEPLLHEGRAWHASGMPVSASTAEMELLGDYQGVEYYARSGDAVAAVYVPVFEGYWQPFRADTAQADTN